MLHKEDLVFTILLNSIEKKFSFIYRVNIVVKNPKLFLAGYHIFLRPPGVSQAERLARIPEKSLN